MSPQTVYGTFGSKRALLFAVFHAAAVGTDDDAGLLDRLWVAAVRAEPDQRRRLALMAQATEATLARTAVLNEVMRVAAASDPEVAAVVREVDERQRADSRVLVELLAEAGPLAMGVTDAGGRVHRPRRERPVPPPHRRRRVARGPGRRAHPRVPRGDRHRRLTPLRTPAERCGRGGVRRTTDGRYRT